MNAHSPSVLLEKEPEIQYHSTEPLFCSIKQWVIRKEARLRKTTSEQALYCDTKNNRLLREGMEVRIKKKDDSYRVDLKTPLDTTQRVVEPDEDHILWRYELKAKTPENIPRLSLFFGQEVLKPVQKRVKNIFDKVLRPKFVACFEKEKYDRTFGKGDKQGVVEYSFQKGHFQNPDGSRKSDTVFIIELELRPGGHKNALIAAKRELEENFASAGLQYLPERKVIMGFRFVETEMGEKERRKFHKAMERQPDMPILAAA